MIEPVNQEFSTLAKRTPEEFKFVKLRSDGGVVRMTLNRPEHNLLNEAMLREMADGIGYAGERDDIKLIVLDSACKSFVGASAVANLRPSVFFKFLTPSTPLSPACSNSASRSSAAWTVRASVVARGSRLSETSLLV